MSSESRLGDLEISQDLDYQHREWVFERIGWCVMGLIVLAALFGLLGSGPLSDTSASDAAGMFKLDYEYFIHYSSSNMLVVHLSDRATQGEQATLWLDQDYIDCVQVQKIVPEPDQVRAGAGRQGFVFNIADQGRPTTVTFYVEPHCIGRLTGHLAACAEKPAAFSQFAYP